MPSNFHDYIVEIDEGPGATYVGNVEASALDIEVFTHEADVVELIETGPRGPAGNPGLVLLEVGEPLPTPVLDGVVYLRLLS